MNTFGYSKSIEELKNVITYSQSDFEFSIPTQNRNEKFLVVVERTYSSNNRRDTFILVNPDSRLSADLLLHVCTLLGILQKSGLSDEANLMSIALFSNFFHPPKQLPAAQKWLAHYFPYLAEFTAPPWTEYLNSADADNSNYSGVIFPLPLQVKVLLNIPQQELQE